MLKSATPSAESLEEGKEQKYKTNKRDGNDEQRPNQTQSKHKKDDDGRNTKKNIMGGNRKE